MSENSTAKTLKGLQLQNVLLKEKLTEAEDALNAIRNGKVDAIVVNTSQGYQVFSLTSAETPYRIIVEEMNEGAATISDSGLILYCNSRFAELVALPIDKVIGCNFKQFIDDDKLQEFNLLLKDAIKKKFTKETSFKVKTTTKGHFLLSFSPLPPNIQGNICIMTMDITELKQQETALRQSLMETHQKKEELINTNKALENTREALSQSLEKFRTVADFTYDWEYWEGKDRAIIYTSPSCERITGYKAEELMADSSLLLKMIHPADVLLMNDHFNKIYRKPNHFNKAQRIDFRIIKKDGAVVYIGHIDSPVFDNKGNYNGRRISNRDITERKLAETEIKELNRDLDKKVIERTAQYETVNKELESFTYSVSHDLRAPLRAINAYTQILDEDYGSKLDEDGKKIMDNIKSNGQKMNRLIDDLLAFSHLGRKELKKDAVNMNELTKSVIEELNQTYPNHAKIQVSNLPVVQGDYTLLHQVMINLISNGIKYSDKKEKPVVEVNAMEKDGKITFVIKDNGAGFDMRFAEKLFGVFQRLHAEEEFEGNGVGLAIVQRIINRHGGKVWGQGKVNEGATFYFTLN